jgi:hypothetical protein
MAPESQGNHSDLKEEDIGPDSRSDGRVHPDLGDEALERIRRDAAGIKADADFGPIIWRLIIPGWKSIRNISFKPRRSWRKVLRNYSGRKG